MFYFEFCGFFVGRLIKNRYFKVRYSIPKINHIFFLSIRYWICNIFTEYLSVIVTAVAQRRVYLRSAWSRMEPGTYISEAGRRAITTCLHHTHAQGAVFPLPLL